LLWWQHKIHSLTLPSALDRPLKPRQQLTHAENRCDDFWLGCGLTLCVKNLKFQGHEGLWPHLEIAHCALNDRLVPRIQRRVNSSGGRGRNAGTTVRESQNRRQGNLDLFFRGG